VLGLSSLSYGSGQITGNPEVIGSSAGLVPRNALVLTGLAILRVVADAETARALVISSASGKTTPVDLVFARQWDP
jgi:hypothetical protein